MKKVAWLGFPLAFWLMGSVVVFSGSSEAPAAFDGQTNGLVDQATHRADQEKFDEVEGIGDGSARFTMPNRAASATGTRSREE